VAVDELSRTAPDVDHQIRGLTIDFGGCSLKREFGLSLSGNDLWLCANNATDGSHECLAVLGIS
jgi:hypothetical protein